MMFILTFQKKTLYGLSVAMYGLSVAMFFALFLLICQKPAKAAAWEQDFETCTSSTECEYCTTVNPTYNYQNETYAESPTHSASAINTGGEVQIVYQPPVAFATTSNLYVSMLRDAVSDDYQNGIFWRNTTFIIAYLKFDQTNGLELTTGDGTVSLGAYSTETWYQIGYDYVDSTHFNISIDGGENWTGPYTPWVAATAVVTNLLLDNLGNADTIYFDNISSTPGYEQETTTMLTYINPVPGSSQIKHCSYAGCGAWGSYIIYFGDDNDNYDNIRVMIFDTYGSTTDLLDYDDWDPDYFSSGATAISATSEWPDEFGTHTAEWQVWGFSGIDSDLLYSTTSSYTIIDYASSTEYLADKITELEENLWLCSDDPCADISSTTDAWYEIVDDLQCWGLWIGHWLICPSNTLVIMLHDKFYGLRERVPYSIYFSLTDYVSDKFDEASTTPPALQLPKPDGDGGLEWVEIATSSIYNQLGTTTNETMRTTIGYIIWLGVALVCGLAVFAVILL